MDRKEFLRKGLIGLGGIVALPTIITSCGDGTSTTGTPGECDLAPKETAGPFPIKTPAELVRDNIVSDRAGIPLVITLTVQDQSNDCQPLAGVLVDIWHCDADGAYSEYGGTQMQSADYTGVHFLRGRQETDANGQVSFVSIYPGWYPGRAPHIHLEVLDSNGSSIRVTQIAFPEDISDAVYETANYNGSADTSNSRDNIFSDSLAANLADSVTGNNTDGYLLMKKIVV